MVSQSVWGSSISVTNFYILRHAWPGLAWSGLVWSDTQLTIAYLI